MSELAKRLEADCGDHCRPTCPFCIVRGLLPAHDAEVSLEAKQEQKDADAAIAYSMSARWGDDVGAAIRAAWSEDHPEEGDHD